MQIQKASCVQILLFYGVVSLHFYVPSPSHYNVIDAIVIKKNLLISLAAISVLFALRCHGMWMLDLTKPPSLVWRDHSCMMQDSDEYLDFNS